MASDAVKKDSGEPGEMEEEEDEEEEVEEEEEEKEAEEEEEKEAEEEEEKEAEEEEEDEDEEEEPDEGEEEEEEEGPETENFSELIRFTAAGWLAGLGLGAILDYYGLQLSAWGGWLVRTLAGEGESIFEGFYALRQRLRKAAGSMAEAYGWGKLAGMFVPGFIDLASRLAGVDVLGLEGFYIPFFYAQSDQIGANISGLVYMKRREKRWGTALRAYFRHPVMVASLFTIIAVPVGLYIARAAGFSPTTQVLAAIETIAANLCWLPPLVGALSERRKN